MQPSRSSSSSSSARSVIISTITTSTSSTTMRIHPSPSHCSPGCTTCYSSYSQWKNHRYHHHHQKGSDSGSGLKKRKRRRRPLILPVETPTLSPPPPPSSFFVDSSKPPKLRPRPRRSRYSNFPFFSTTNTTTTTIFFIFLTLLSITIQPAHAALRILLTNDDGIDTPGIQALRTALVADGHDVHVYAPAKDRTGLSASVALSVPFQLLEDNVVVVEGPPASCVVAGLTFMEQQQVQQVQPPPMDGTTATDALPPPPTPSTTSAVDLVIVGISDGFPTGAQTLHSSSVGAALSALARGIPALTVAALPPPTAQEMYYENVANFTVRFLRQWLVTIPLNRMPKGFGIKIAYPEVTPTAVDATTPPTLSLPKGIQLADNGLRAPISLGYTPASAENPNVYQITAVVEEEEEEDATASKRDNESAIVDSGYISILPISYRYYVLERDFNVRFILTLKRMIRGLQP